MSVKRKSLSKKIRFEVFKRDSFACQYCGATPPSVVLEVDHIDPVSKGGGDDVNNLITACFDCNRGKTNISLDRIIPSMEENLSLMRQKEEQLSEYRKFITKIKRRRDKDINAVAFLFTESFPDKELASKFKRVSVGKFLDCLPLHEVEDSMDKACSAIGDPDDAVKYFCGICWNKIKANDPAHKIEKLWIRLSQEHKRGIGYCKKTDLDKIKDRFNLPEIEQFMGQALSERRKSYWKAFMTIVEEQPY